MTEVLHNGGRFRVGPGGEGSHYYVPSPAACAYEVLGKNGKWRGCTLRDAREYGLFPGVTSVMNLTVKPQLERWKVRQGIMSALTYPRLDELLASPTDAMKVIERDSQEQSKVARDVGTAVHAAIEEWYAMGQVTDESFLPHVNGIDEAISAEFGWCQWRTEVAACHPFGYGTRVDLHRAGIVLDFKGKDGDLSDVKLYPEHGMQLVAGAKALHMWPCELAIVFFSRTEPGRARVITVPEKYHEKLWRRFCGRLIHWQSENDMPVLAGEIRAEVAA